MEKSFFSGKHALALLIGTGVVAGAGTARGQSAELLNHWSDGRAELAGYKLVMPRYGELRSGSVVLIYVKEPFSESARVKADPGKHPDDDVFSAFKLNVVKDFQTGIYDYNLMTSVFVALEPWRGQRAGAPSKIVFSSQEWCGALFEELLFDLRSVRKKRFSYFDGEGDEDDTLLRPQDGLTVDELPIVVRGLPIQLLQPGESKKLDILPSLERVRLVHKPLEWTKGTLSRTKKAERFVVPAGTFEVETYLLEIEGGDTYAYRVEKAFPHRLIAWTGPEGEKAELTGVERLDYWNLHGEGKERMLPKLGLPVPTKR